MRTDEPHSIVSTLLNPNSNPNKLKTPGIIVILLQDQLIAATEDILLTSRAKALQNHAIADHQDQSLGLAPTSQIFTNPLMLQDPAIQARRSRTLVLAQMTTFSRVARSRPTKLQVQVVQAHHKQALALARINRVQEHRHQPLASARISRISFKGPMLQIHGVQDNQSQTLVLDVIRINGIQGHRNRPLALVPALALAPTPALGRINPIQGHQTHLLALALAQLNGDFPDPRVLQVRGVQDHRNQLRGLARINRIPIKPPVSKLNSLNNAIRTLERLA